MAYPAVDTAFPAVAHSSLPVEARIDLDRHIVATGRGLLAIDPAAVATDCMDLRLGGAALEEAAEDTQVVVLREQRTCFDSGRPYLTLTLRSGKNAKRL